jgi:hypothetical protein
MCPVVSKAFSVSKNAAAVDILLLKFNVTWSVSLVHWSVMDTETKLSCIKQSSFFNVPLNYLQNNFPKCFLFITRLLIVVVQLLPWEHVCLWRSYSVTAALHLLIPKSLTSNGSTCYNMLFFVLLVVLLLHACMYIILSRRIMA